MRTTKLMMCALPWWCLAVGPAFVAVHAGAGEPVAQAQAAKDVLPTLYAVRDAKTGQLRPMSDEERKAAGLPELLKRDSAGLVPTPQANGAVVTPLTSTYQNAVMIKRNPDGSFTTSCVDTMDAARKFTTTKAASEADHAK
jgi:hypothetical protein